MYHLEHGLRGLCNIIPEAEGIRLKEFDWKTILEIKDANQAYVEFCDKFMCVSKQYIKCIRPC